jgi:hypothetical protein
MNKLPKLEKEVWYCLKYVKLGLALSTRAMDPDGEQGSGIHNNIARGERPKSVVVTTITYVVGPPQSYEHCKTRYATREAHTLRNETTE